MKLSTRSRYGLRALLDIAKHGGRHPVMLRDISERQDISAKYLEHLLADLRRAEILRSFRGAGGGFELCRATDRIDLLEVVSVLENDFVTTECVSEPDFCTRSVDCATRRVWAMVSNAMRKTLAGITLAELMKMDAELTRSPECEGATEKVGS